MTLKYEIAYDDETLDELRKYDLVYVATPYSIFEDGLDAAHRAACQITGDLLRYGVNAFSPIVHSHHVAEHANIDRMDHKFWMRADEAYMKKCDALVVAQIDNWENSVGVNMELKHFRDVGKPIHFIMPNKADTVFETAINKVLPAIIIAVFAVVFAIAFFGK
jgi:nucleoside 2-deoxyribosyltransferase